jgi:hypothetical protein
MYLFLAGSIRKSWVKEDQLQRVFFTVLIIDGFRTTPKDKIFINFEERSTPYKTTVPNQMG